MNDIGILTTITRTQTSVICLQVIELDIGFFHTPNTSIAQIMQAKKLIGM